MKIVQLHAENFKRLGVVEITPTGNVVTIGGNNGEGKSSVLDAIFVALKGRAVAPPKPIRTGEERCTIRLDMGDVIVTRNFHAKDGGEYTDTIKVENSEGLRYSKPDQLLKSLLGDVGFDPFAFVGLKPKDQAAQLLEMVPLSIDLDEFADQDRSDFDNRRDVNRDVARLKAQVDGIAAEDVPADAPDRAALTDALGNAADTNAGVERERIARETTARNIEGLKREAVLGRESAVEFRRRADEADERAAGLDQQAAGFEKDLAGLGPLAEPVDTDALRAQLRDAEAVLASIDRQTRRKALVAELTAAEAKSQGYTDAMISRAKERNEALASAEMPVPGLAFAISEAGHPVLTYDGLPFDKDQISTAVQLRVSTAIGMAANPRLRVLRISDGSLLDAASMKMLTEMAEAEDFQLWVEVVGDGGVGIVMENGLVRGAAEPDQPAPLGEVLQDDEVISPAPKKKAAKGKATAGETLL
ncbi:MAG: ATP-binding protein [Nocardioides sp.]